MRLAHIRSERYYVLHLLLTAERERQEARIRELRRNLKAEPTDVTDEEELAEADTHRDTAGCEITLASGVLAKIEDAFVMLERGTFGKCVDCGEDIAENRLKAVPFTELCIGCARTREDVPAVPVLVNFSPAET